MAQKWLWPFRKNRQNLEAVLVDGSGKQWAILHDVGFSGDKLYYPGKLEGAGFHKDWGFQGNNRKRNEVMAYIKRQAKQSNPFKAGLNRTWYTLGKVKGKSGKYSDMYEAWRSLPKGRVPMTPGKAVEAKESFFQGYLDGSPQGNPAPKNKWIKASAIRIRKVGGKTLIDIKKK